MTNMTVENKQTSLMSQVMGLLMICLGETALTVYLTQAMAVGHMATIFTFGGMIVSLITIFIMAMQKDEVSLLTLFPLFITTTAIGLMISPYIHTVLQMHNGVQSINLALVSTIGLTAFFGVWGALFKGSLESIGKLLFAGLIFLIIASIFGIFIHATAFQLTLSALTIVIFSGYIFYDVSQAVRNNYTVLQTVLNLYLDIMNLFLSILSIVSGNNKN